MPYTKPEDKSKTRPGGDTANTLRRPRGAGRAVSRALAVAGVTLALVLVALMGVMWVLTKGPSPTAKRIFTMSVKETSAIGFLADIYLSKEEVAEILASKQVDTDVESTNTSLITITAGNVSTGDGGADEPAPGAPETEPITVEEVKGASYRGYMMIVADPSRLFVGAPNTYGEGSSGLTLEQMVEKYGAVAGINAGGFYDPNGGGTGGTPDGIVILDGELAWGGNGTRSSVVGFDGDSILHVGYMSGREALDAGIQWAVSFGPALIINGEAQSETGSFASGVNPRTAIGQRADGAVLMLVVDGRQVSSLGATYDDLVNIMLDYGAMNAGNLDGGSSTLMIYNGEELNNCASVYGPREIPTAFLVGAQ